MKKAFISRRVRCLLVAAVVALAAGVGGAYGDDAAADLKIAVTAVQGKAEVKVTPDAKWERVTLGMQLPVGCQIRTGVPGTVQLQVGEDQVCRVDRLSLVQVVQAEEDHGKIKTVMGMTYGRVSKDVDAPVVPHEDTIVSPTSTLAVRGTRVSLYDQPPYAPEAVSLTGAAVYTNPKHRRVAIGQHGGPKAKVDADSDSAAGFALQSGEANPAPGTDAVLHLASQGASQDFVSAQQHAAMAIGEFKPLPGLLVFQLSWTGTSLSVLDFGVTSPTGTDFVKTISPAPPFVPATAAIFSSVPTDGKYVNGVGAGIGTVASAGGAGTQEIQWGVSGMFPTGTYTITEKLEGTTTATLGGGASIVATLDVTDKIGNSAPKLVASGPVMLTGPAPGNAATFSYTINSGGARTLVKR